MDLDLLLDALDRLERHDPSDDAPVPLLKRSGTRADPPALSPKAVIATLRLLMDWPVDEIAEHLGLSPERTQREWAFARAFVRKHLAETGDAD